MRLILAKANRADKFGNVLTEDCCKEMHGKNGILWNSADKTLEIEMDVSDPILVENHFLVGKTGFYLPNVQTSNRFR